VYVGEAALAGGVQILAGAKPFGHRGFDSGFDGADTVVGLEVCCEVASCVGEAEANWRWLVQGFAANLGSEAINTHCVGFEVEHNGALCCGAVLPVAFVDGHLMGLDRSVADNGPGLAALRAWLRVTRIIRSAAAAHLHHSKH